MCSHVGKLSCKLKSNLSLKSMFPKIKHEEEKIQYCSGEKANNHYLKQVIKVNITNNKTERSDPPYYEVKSTLSLTRYNFNLIMMKYQKN